jgi:hypothetical protein
LFVLVALEPLGQFVRGINYSSLQLYETSDKE